MMHCQRMTAKYPGTCNTCSEPITPGQKIVWARGKGVHHVDCELARLERSGCPACSGRGCSWNGAPCRVCDGTGSRAVYDRAREVARADYERCQGGA